MIYALLGLAAGIALGAYFPVVPPMYSKLVAVAFMGCLDAAFGGYRSSLEGHFNHRIFLSGFFANGIFAVFLCYFGYRLGIDRLRSPDLQQHRHYPAAADGGLRGGEQSPPKKAKFSPKWG